MKALSLDIESYSSTNLAKSGVYRYALAEDFEILLLGYSVDSGPVRVVDLSCGEKIPAEILRAIKDETVTKWAFNAHFERIPLASLDRLIDLLMAHRIGLDQALEELMDARDLTA